MERGWGDTEGEASPHCVRGEVPPARDSPLRITRPREGGAGRERCRPPCRCLRCNHHYGIQLPGHRSAQLHAKALPQGTYSRRAGAGQERGGASGKHRLHHLLPGAVEAPLGIEHHWGGVNPHSSTGIRDFAAFLLPFVIQEGGSAAS